MRKYLSLPLQISLGAIAYIYSSSDVIAVEVKNLAAANYPAELKVTESPLLLAQITTDGTLNTEVTQNGNVSEITGGSARDSNLFHSFQDFSLPNGNEAFFDNAAEINNIFSRVTGGNISDINGSIRANDANLFLVNPAGIIFGNNASLNLGGGSFYGSTADSILFQDGEFSAVDLDNPPLLTINAPIGLNFRDNPAPIEVNGSELAVAAGQNLSLLGGNLTLRDSVRLFTPGANVQLGAISGSGIVELDENFRFNFPENIALADVFLNDDIGINVTSNDGGSISINGNNIELLGNSRLIAGISDNNGSPESQAGNITINSTGDLKLEGNSFIVNRVGNNAQGNGGGIQITTSSGITLDGNSFINSEVGEGGQGNAGNIQIDTTSLTLNNRSSVGSQTFGQGNSGNVTINAEDTVAINSGSSLRSLVRAGGIGNAGDIQLNTGILTAETIEGSAENRSLIFSNTRGGGNAGNVTINASDSVSFDNSSILAQVDEGASGDGGNVIINTPTLEIFNSASEVTTASGIFTDTKGTGNAGNINITTSDALIIERRSSIGAGTTSDGNAGDINIATDLLSLSNFALIATNVRENAAGDAGAIEINANTLNLSEGAIIDASVINTNRPTDFKGGDININANSLNLISGGKIATNTSNSSGNAGNINLTIADNIVIEGSNPPSLPPEFAPFQEQDVELESVTGLLASNRLGAVGNGGDINITSPNAVIEIANGEAQISVSSQGQGSGGSITIAAQELTLDNNGSIFASTPSGEGGSISLNIDEQIVLRNDSTITAQAFNNAKGGNITIDAGFIVAFPSTPNGSDITAKAESGDGGNIKITASEILGLQEKIAIDGNGTNDIDASSEFGFDGSISIESSDVNSLRGIVELSSNIVQPNDNVARGCASNNSANSNSSLVVSGKGGVPTEPVDVLSNETILLENLSASSARENPSSTPSKTEYQAIATGQGDIYPARGVMVREDGTIMLTAYPIATGDQRGFVTSPNCPDENSINGK